MSKRDEARHAAITDAIVQCASDDVSQPCPHLPGTPERVAWYALRYGDGCTECGLHDPSDRNVPLPGEPSHLRGLVSASPTPLDIRASVGNHRRCE